MNIFQGKTISPVREYIADLISECKPKRILMPCAGSFAVVFLLSEEQRKLRIARILTFIPALSATSLMRTAKT